MDTKIKSIAVAVAGIDEEYQNNIIKGINSYAKSNNVNVSYFAAFGGVLKSNLYDSGEYNIYELPNFDRFDGVILMTNTICSEQMRADIYDKVIAAGVPVVILDCDKKEFFNISIDNTSAMKEIVRHVIKDHEARVINYISGPLSNSEAEERYQAFVDVMAENGMIIDRNRVYFGEFRSLDGKAAIDTFMNSGLSAPDAIICANDAMALAAVSQLETYGYYVPEDIIVTGFDNTYNARHHSPTLTTVARPLFRTGSIACETICRLIDGDTPKEEIKLEARPVFAGSCGCPDKEEKDIGIYKRSTFHKIEGLQNEITLLNRLTSALAETESVEETVRVAAQHISEISCEKFYICLCSDWQGAFDDLDKEMPSKGYTEMMSVPLVFANKEAGQGNDFPSRDMFPEKLTTGGNISYFLPLHFRERCLGYYVILNSDFPINSMLCHSMMMNISNSFEHIRQLVNLNKAIGKLERLYVMDTLCNIYNRNGFTRATADLLAECMREHKKLMVSFVDMDGMKQINDSYGHKEGDFALQRLTDAIKQSCSRGYICARFGGDEFVIIAADQTEEQARDFEKRFEKRLAEINARIHKPYEISASIGSFITEADVNTKIHQLITQADSRMYEEKKRKKHSKYIRSES